MSENTIIPKESFIPIYLGLKIPKDKLLTKQLLYYSAYEEIGTYF